MTDLDSLLRTGLAEAMAPVDGLPPAELAARLAAARGDRRPTRGRRLVLAAACVAAVAVVAGGLALQPWRDDAEQVRTTPAPTTTSPTPPDGPRDLGAWGELAPGWYPLDPGPVPAQSGPPGMAWTGDELVVAGMGVAHAYDPTTQAWRDVGLPAAFGAGAVDLVRADGVVVAVSRGEEGGALASAAWEPATGSWRDLGTVPVAPALTAALGLVGASGPSVAGRSALFWTGQRVIDLSHGAVLDPIAGTWSELALPDDLVRFSALLSATPVWTGTELVDVGWSTGSGLAWDATGSTYREVPGIPESLDGLDMNTTSSMAVARGGRVLVVTVEPTELLARTGTSRAAELDPATGTWTEVPAPPGFVDAIGCPRLGVVVAGEPVVERCSDGGPVLWRAGSWIAGDAAPVSAGSYGLTAWEPAGPVLVGWDTDADEVNDPEAPFVDAFVWVPPAP